jgi:hypothetical protein
MGQGRPGPQCLSTGGYYDGEDQIPACFAPGCGPRPAHDGPCGPLITSPTTPVETALYELEAEATTFSIRFIPDYAVRRLYADSIKGMSDEIMRRVRTGEMTAQEGQMVAHQARNEILAITRKASSDVALAWSKGMKEEGYTLEFLQEKYAQQGFGKVFSQLGEADRNTVYLKIVDSAGRPNADVMVCSSRLSMSMKGLIFVTAALAVYFVVTSNDPLREAAKQGTVIEAGVLGGGVAGMYVAPLVCAATAPVCVAALVFVGGAAVAYGAERYFEWAFPAARRH